MAPATDQTPFAVDARTGNALVAFLPAGRISDSLGERDQRRAHAHVAEEVNR